MASGESDSPEAYLRRVSEYFSSRGWELDRTHVSNSVYLFGGSVPTDTGSERVVAIIAAGGDEQLDRSHVEYAQQAIEKYDADTAYVHARGGIPDGPAKLCADQGIHIIEPAAVGGAVHAAGTVQSNGVSANDGDPASGDGDSTTVSRRWALSAALLGGAAVGGWLVFGGGTDSAPGRIPEPDSDGGGTPTANGTEDGGTEDGDGETASTISLRIVGDAETAWQYQLADDEVPRRPTVTGDGVYLMAAISPDLRSESPGETGSAAIHGGRSVLSVSIGAGTKQWRRYDIGDGTAQSTQGFNDISVTDDSVLTIIDSNVDSLATTDGTTRWEYEPTAPEHEHTYVSRLTTDDERAYLDGSYTEPMGSFMLAVDRQNGAVAWKETGQSFGRFLGVRDGILCGVTNDRITALDAATGTERWHVASEDLERRSVHRHDGTVYAGEDRGATGVVRAVATIDGSERWQTELPYDDVDGINGFAVTGDTVAVWSRYTTDDDSGANAVYALDAATGTERWHFQRPSLTLAQLLAATDDTVYIQTVVDDTEGNSHKLRALDAETGSERWQFRSESGDLSPLAFDGETVYTIGGGDVAYALDTADGSELWRAEIETNRDSVWGFGEPPVVGPSGNVYLVLDDTGKLYKVTGA